MPNKGLKIIAELTAARARALQQPVQLHSGARHSETLEAENRVTEAGYAFRSLDTAPLMAFSGRMQGFISLPPT